MSLSLSLSLSLPVSLSLLEYIKKNMPAYFSILLNSHWIINIPRHDESMGLTWSPPPSTPRSEVIDWEHRVAYKVGVYDGLHCFLQQDYKKCFSKMYVLVLGLSVDINIVYVWKNKNPMQQEVLLTYPPGTGGRKHSVMGYDLISINYHSCVLLLTCSPRYWGHEADKQGVMGPVQTVMNIEQSLSNVEIHYLSVWLYSS